MSSELARIYLSNESKKRLKNYANLNNLTMKEAIDSLIMSCIDEDGRPRSIVISEEDVEDLEEIARMLGVSVNEAVSLIIKTVKVLYSPFLTLAEALKPIPELEKIIHSKEDLLKKKIKT